VQKAQGSRGSPHARLLNEFCYRDVHENFTGVDAGVRVERQLGIGWLLAHSAAAAADLNSTGTVSVASIVLTWLRADKEANFRRVEPS